MTYANPILPGFHPDPSICRVGEDYYLVNSSFEYFPGVPIFHSRDLVHWRQIGHCLTRKSQLPLEATPPSDGIYAPTIRHHEDRFYMVTTNNIPGKGFRNFYVHADDPAGEWSEPIWVEQGGIDPSLFFDGDGKVYFTGNGTRWAPVRGAYQSEIDIATGRLLTDIRFLWPGTGGAYPEAPHLFKRGKFYYLMMAEGGTSECHMVTISRSKNPWGPFVNCPHNPVLSMRSLMNPIQATGHADFIEDHLGNWWAVFLGYRYAEGMFHNLGRETYLAPMEWTADGWPVINGGARIALLMDTGRDLPAHPWPEEPARDDFDSSRLGLCWNYLRNPHEADYSLASRPGWLQMRCADATLDDMASPSFLGRRQRDFECAASALIDFSPGAENEEAGLTALIDNHHHYEIAVTRRGDRRIIVAKRRAGTLSATVEGTHLADGPVTLRIRANKSWYHLGFVAADGSETIVDRGEVKFLSSEVAGGYTGVYLGMYATANGGQSATLASFDHFELKSEHPHST